MHSYINPNPSMGFLILLIIPIFFWFNLKLRVQYVLITLVITSAFVEGSLEILNIITPSDLRLFRDGLIIILFCKAIFDNKLKNNNIKTDGLMPLFILFIVILVSFAINDITPMQLGLFLRRMFICFLFFYSILNIYISNRNQILFNKYISYLFIAQILANVCKFFIVGQMEPYIGTMSFLGGSLTTIFALIGSSFSFSFFLYKKQWKFLLLLTGFIMFSIIGNKRAMVFYLPFLLIAIFCTFKLKYNLEFLINFKKLSQTILLSIITFYLVVILTPTLNPDHRTWGRFDLDYLTKYIEDYMNPQKKNIRYYGRGEAPSAVFRLLTQKNHFMALFFGLGPGDIMVSRFSKNIFNKAYNRPEDVIAAKYNIGYGARTGLLWMMLQVGIFGVISYLTFYIILLYRIFLAFKNSYEIMESAILLGIIGSIITFFLDYLTYSQVLIQNRCLTFVFLFILATATKKSYKNYS